MVLYPFLVAIGAIYLYRRCIHLSPLDNSSTNIELSEKTHFIIADEDDDTILDEID